MAKAKRKLAVLLSADVVGYSRLMGDDDAETVRALKDYRQLFAARIERFHGRVVDMHGDALLAEFGSAIDAVECAALVQSELAQRNRAVAEERRLQCRIGVTLGDVLEEDQALFGDGVNVAARLESMAEPGGICVSGKIFDEIDGKLRIDAEALGEQRLKNIRTPLRVYRLRPPAALHLKVLGEIELWRGDQRIELPQSKKTRALLAYLAITQRGLRRERLCDLFWDITDDPRAALRWSLSKLRALVDEPGLGRIVTDGGNVRFDATGTRIDLFALRERLAPGSAPVSRDELLRLAAEFRGDFLEGLELPDFQEFQFWCVGLREETRTLHARVLRALLEQLEEDPQAALPYARRLAQVDPFDIGACTSLLRLLVRLGHRREAEHHYESVRRALLEVGSDAAQQLVKIWQGLEHSPTSHTPPPPSVTIPSPAVAPAPAAASVVARLIGRRSEWGCLLAELARVSQERSLRALSLMGEPGIGKTRLLDELIEEVRRRGGSVLHGRAYEAETTRPYVPWIDALRRVPAVSVGDTIGSDLAPLLPELGGGEAAQTSRERLFGAVVELVAARAHSAPPVLVAIDDAHWCDTASAELLHYVTRMSRNRPVLVVLAVRAGELPDNEAMPGVLRGLRRDGLLVEVDLAPLSGEETEELLYSLVPGSVRGSIPEDSAGNPLYALELARAQTRPGEGVPATLRQLVRDRVDRLPADAADVLRWGAVLGPQFDANGLSEHAPFETDRLIPALETLERHALLHAVNEASCAGGAYRFAHGIVRDVVYGDLSAPRRRLMHLRVSQVLRERVATHEALAADLAHHAALAGEAAVAARACVLAGHGYLRVFAAKEADAVARRGMHLAAPLAEPERVRLLLELAEVRYAARRPRQPAAAARAVEELAQLAFDQGCMEHARLGFHIASYIRWEGGDWSDARRQMLRAEEASRFGDERQRMVALAEAARCLTLLEHDLPQADAMLAEAGALSTRLAVEPAAIPDAIGMLRLHEGNLDAAADSFVRARHLCRVAQDRLGEFRALEHLLAVELQRRRIEAAQERCSELEEIAARVREGSEVPFAHAASALCRYVRTPRAEGELEAGIAELRAADAKQRLSFVLRNAAEADLERGAAEPAQRRALEALGYARRLERPSDEVLARMALARAALGSGDRAACERQLNECGLELMRLASAEARAAVASVRAALSGPGKSSRGRRRSGREEGRS